MHLPSLAEVEKAIDSVRAAIPALEAVDALLPEPERTTIKVALKVADEVLGAVSAALHELA